MAKLPKGVSLTGKGRYQSRIFRDGRSVHLGVFDDVEEAAAAYQAAALSKKQPIASPPVTAQPPPTPPIPAPPEPVANLKPSAKAFPPGTCPNDGSVFVELGGARRCALCGCQPAMWGPGSINRTELAARSWKARQ